MVAPCRIELFGGLRIIQGEAAISRFRTQKTAALLAFLAYHRDRAHPREALVDMLWPWAEPAAGRSSLSMALSSLRHQLEPPGVPAGAVLMADRTNVQLSPETVSTDVVEFEAALSAARRTADKAAKEMHLEEAIRLYRGELLPGLYESWIPPEQVRLSELYVGAVVELAGLLAERGEATEAASHLRRAIEAEPLREEPYRQLMRLNAERGESGAALATYRELERVFAEELGEKPSAATRRLVKELERLATRAPGASLRAASVDPPRPTRRRAKAKLPAGIVTFLLVRADGDANESGACAARELREEVKRHGGIEIETGRAKYALAFDRAGDALTCAAQCQLRPAAVPSSTPFAMAVHTAEVGAKRDGFHPALHRTERLLAAAHPAQVLCSEATAGLLRYDLDGGLSLRDLGVYRLRGASATERIFELDYPGGPDTSAPLDAESGHSGHLPHQITRFFGRQQEIERLEAMLRADARLATLIGPPGCGKTRLAIEVARRLVEPFKGNVWFVPLADLREGSDILDRALDPLGIRRSPQASPLDQIGAALAEQQALIVFDNFEHLVESAGDVRALLERLPDLRCLVTSRRRLGSTGEREFPVAPLPVPGEVSFQELLRNESVQLFVDRAQAVKPDFQLTDGNAETVARLCRRLEGVPLAIELAAARSHTQGLGQILERIAEGEDLATRSRDAEERHRSLRAAVEWSYELLSPEIQRFFARLSVFRGGWTVEAAEAVCEEPLASDYLMQLVELSLVQLDQEAGPEQRYRMLEMARQYAAEQLAASRDQASILDSHARHFCGLVERFFENRNGPDGVVWTDRMQAEHENLLSALDRFQHAPDGLENALTMSGKLSDFWKQRGFLTLGHSNLDKVLRSDSERKPTLARARALLGAGMLAFELGAVEGARTCHSEALAIARLAKARDLEAESLNCLGIVAREQADYARAKDLFTEAVALYRTLGDERKAENTTMNLGAIAFDQGDYDTALQIVSEHVEQLRRRGEQSRMPLALMNLGGVAEVKQDYALAKRALEEGMALAQGHQPPMVAGILCNLGALAKRMGDVKLAVTRYSEALKISRELGDGILSAHCRLSLGFLYNEAGDLERSRTHLLESLHCAVSLGDKAYTAFSFEYIGGLAIAQANRLSCREREETLAKHAARLYAAARAIKNETGAVTVNCTCGECCGGSLRDELGAPLFDAAWDEGLAMTYDQAIAYAVDFLEKLEVSPQGSREPVPGATRVGR